MIQEDVPPLSESVGRERPRVMDAFNTVMCLVADCDVVEYDGRIGCIYVWLNTVNGACYVGKTINFVIRTYQHLSPNSPCKNFRKAISEHGIEAFTPIVRRCPEFIMDRVERVMISAFK